MTLTTWWTITEIIRNPDLRIAFIMFKKYAGTYLRAFQFKCSYKMPLKTAINEKWHMVLMSSHTSFHNSHDCHDDVIKWTHFPRYWPFVRGFHRSPVNSPHKSKWRAALMFSLICVRINGWVNNREAGDLRRHRTHYDVTVMVLFCFDIWLTDMI